jgi:hypothetical protein
MARADRRKGRPVEGFAIMVIPCGRKSRANPLTPHNPPDR